MRILTLLLCLCFSLSVPASAFADAAARVLSVTPGVDYNLSGASEPLAVKMDVPIKAEVVSDATGKAQLMFPDDSTLSIAPDTRITLAEYVVAEQEENIVLDLLSGTARVITGETNRKNPQAFTVNTPQASIGIRGTLVTIQAGGDVTRVYLSETSGKGVSVRNLNTGQVIELRKPGTIINVGANFMEERKAQKEEAASFSAALRGMSRQRIQQAAAGASAMQKAAVASLAPEGTLPPASLASEVQLTALNMADHLDHATLIADATQASPLPPAVSPTVPDVPVIPEVPLLPADTPLPVPDVDNFVITDINELTNATFKGIGNFHLTYKEGNTFDDIRDVDSNVILFTRSASEIDANSFGLGYYINVPFLNPDNNNTDLKVVTSSLGDLITGNLNLKLNGKFSAEKVDNYPAWDRIVKLEGKFLSPTKVKLTNVTYIRTGNNSREPDTSSILNAPVEVNRTN